MTGNNWSATAGKIQLQVYDHCTDSENGLKLESWLIESCVSQVYGKNIYRKEGVRLQKTRDQPPPKLPPTPPTPPPTPQTPPPTPPNPNTTKSTTYHHQSHHQTHHQPSAFITTDTMNHQLPLPPNTMNHQLRLPPSETLKRRKTFQVFAKSSCSHLCMTCGPWRDEARTQRVELTKRVVSFGRRSAWQEVCLRRLGNRVYSGSSTLPTPKSTNRHK